MTYHYCTYDYVIIIIQLAQSTPAPVEKNQSQNQLHEGDRTTKVHFS